MAQFVPFAITSPVLGEIKSNVPPSEAGTCCYGEVSFVITCFCSHAHLAIDEEPSLDLFLRNQISSHNVLNSAFFPLEICIAYKNSTRFPREESYLVIVSASEAVLTPCRFLG